MKATHLYAQIFLLVALLLMGAALTFAQAEGGNNVAIILDASGSMQALLDGNTRIDIAREAVITTAGELPAGTNASLWVYGHRLPQDDPAASCLDIEQVIPFGEIDIDSFSTTVRNIDAIGYTPISDTLQQAAASFPEGGPRTIVLISDGEETCAADPCAVAQKLKNNNVDLVVNTIGLAVDSVTRSQLQCVAQVTGGVYYEADDAAALAASLQAAAVVPDGSVRIIDPQGNALPEIPFALFNAETNEPIGSFVGSATVPAGMYTAEVRIGELVVETITVNPDETTDIVVNPIPVGGIQLVDEDGNPLEETRFAVNHADGTYLGSYIGSANIPADSYQIEVATIIPFNTEVTVIDGEVSLVVVDTDAGTIRLVDEATGNVLEQPLFEIYVAESDTYLGAHVGSYDIPPGVYQVRVRSQIPFTVNVTVEADGVVDIPLSTETGTIRLVDEASGAILEDPLFEIYVAETEEYLGAHSGSHDVPPGVYEVRVRTQVPQVVEVTVESGGVVDVPVSTAAGTIRLVDAATGAVLQEPLFEIYLAETGDYFGAQSGSYDVPPGVYEVRIRWIIPETTEVTVTSGETVDVPLNTALGSLQLTDGSGAVIEAPLFEIYRVSDNTYLGGQSGSFDVPPGVYTIVVRASDTIERFEITVTVTEGSVTTIDAVNQSTNNPG